MGSPFFLFQPTMAPQPAAYLLFRYRLEPGQFQQLERFVQHVRHIADPVLSGGTCQNGGLAAVLTPLSMQHGFPGFRHHRQDLMDIADNAVCGNLKDRRLWIVVDGDDHVRRLHA